MFTPLSKRRKEYLKNHASAGQTRAVLARTSRVEVSQTVNMHSTDADGRLEMSHRPMLGGVVVGGEYNDAGEARAEARRQQAAFGLHSQDVDISDVPSDIHERLVDSEGNWVIDGMWHLGTLLRAGCGFSALDQFEDVMSDLYATVQDPKTRQALRNGDTVYPTALNDLPPPPESDEDDPLDDDSAFEEWQTGMMDAGLFGFLVQVRTPVPEYREPDERCFTFSWGLTASDVLYAESLEEIWRQADAFEAEVHEKARQDARQRQPQEA